MADTYRDPSRSVEDRVADLIGRMTLREKVGQLQQRLLGWRAWERRPGGFGTTRLLDEEADRWAGIGAIYGLQRADAWSGQSWAGGIRPEEGAEVGAIVQERIVSASRFGIPALFSEEAPHGHQALGSQLFPTILGVAASRRTDLWEEAAAQAAREMRARGTHLALVSGLDLLRDPRWGRSEETFGEDPLLAARFIRASVRGTQSVPGVGVVLKAFAGQGAGIGGRNSSGAPIGAREMAEIHLPPMRAGVEEGAVAVMAAYNDVDGEPCIASRRLLTDILRTGWGFDGLVMADMFAVDRLLRSAPSAAAAGALAVRAGVDLSMCDQSFEVLESAVAEGLLDEAEIDLAASRVLGVKVRLGLLDPPEPAPAFPPPIADLDLVAATSVLLADDGGLLPLAARPARVAVIGPNGDDVPCLLGDYTPPLAPGAGVSVAAALRERGIEVRVEPGSGHLGPLPGGVTAAVAAADGADLALVVLGGTSERGYDDDFQANGAASLQGSRPRGTSGEGFDIAELALPEAQVELARAVAATGVPTIAVVIAGRPHGIGAVREACGTVLYSWYPGPHGGTAIVDLLLGEREPTGRLPVSIPASSGVLPVAYDERLETTLRYVDAPGGPEFAFGAGLGYTSWELGAPVATSASVARSGLTELALSAELANVGPRAGRQVVALFARSLVSGVTSRRAVLAGETAVELAPGGRATVRVPVDRDALDHLGADLAGLWALDLWLSVDGAGEPVDPVRVAVD